RRRVLLPVGRSLAVVPRTEHACRTPRAAPRGGRKASLDVRRGAVLRSRPGPRDGPRARRQRGARPPAVAGPVRLLVTGATGKVGRALIDTLLGKCEIRALCHNRPLDVDGVESIFGTIADRATARAAMAGVTHVVHLATCKETPDDIMDVAVKGLFWLLEEARESPTFKRFVLIGGDAAVGHFHYKHPGPVTETQRHTAYPGCYALSKVLEEVMLGQYSIAYGLDG